MFRDSTTVSREWSQEVNPFSQFETLSRCSATASAVASVSLSCERSQLLEPFLQFEKFRWCSEVLLC
jgi:hypothetical protein